MPKQGLIHWYILDIVWYNFDTSYQTYQAYQNGTLLIRLIHLYQNVSNFPLCCTKRVYQNIGPSSNLGTHRLEESGYPARPRCVTPPGIHSSRHVIPTGIHFFLINGRRRRPSVSRREAAASRPPEAAGPTDRGGTHRLEESGYSTKTSLFH